MGAGRGYDQSQLLIVRLLTVAIALVAATKVLYFLPVIRSEASAAALAPFTVGLVGEFAVPILAGGAAFALGLRVLRRVNGATVVGHVLASALALMQSATPDNTVLQPWLLVAAGPVMAAVIFWRPHIGSLFGVLLAYAILGFPRADNTAAYVYLRATFDFQLVTVAVLGGLTAATIAYSRRLDTLAVEASVQVEVAATTRARAEVSVMAAALTHDNILSTLLFGAANNPRFRKAVAEQAKGALAEIERLSSESVADGGADVTALWARVERMVTGVAPDAVIVKSSAGRGEIPAAVAEAILGAVLQAMTNSLAHAGVPGTPVNPQVTLAGTAGSIDVQIEDDGVGFDPARVPLSRIGIKSSIMGRMAAVPGGSATVDSRPGRGTTVRLRWRRVGAATASAGNARDFLAADFFTIRMARAASGVLIVALVCLASFSTINGGNGIASLVALIALCVPIAILAREQFLPSASTIVAVLTGTGIAASMAFFQGFSSPVMRSDFWFLTGCSFMLMWLLRSRYGWLAWVGMVMVALLAVTAAVAHGAGILSGVDLVVRPVVILLVAGFCSLTVDRLQRRITAVRAESSRSLDEQTFNAAVLGQRQSEAVRLRYLAGPLLEILAAGTELTSLQARECAALEGTLRDEVLGGRLSRHGIVIAAAHARRQGVDVVLLDDGDLIGITEEELSLVETWMSGHLANATAGRFVGRIPPAGSHELATIVTADAGGQDRVSLLR